jgi:class 3 adenylate cyclase
MSAQPALALPPPAPSNIVVINARCCLRIEADERVIVVAGLAVHHYRGGDGVAEAYAMVFLVESGFAQQTDVAASPPATAGLALDFGIALHLGQVIYGNVGVPERLQFTLVGSAVNEVVRVQDLTKQLGCPLLATASFAGAGASPWRPLGEHLLRGFDKPMSLLTMSWAGGGSVSSDGDRPIPDARGTISGSA